MANRLYGRVDTTVSREYQYGAQVCLEGIEDEAMLVALESMNADLYQGYLFSKPVDVEELMEILDGQDNR